MFLLAVGAVSASSAFDALLNDFSSDAVFDVQYFDEDTNVSIGEHNFTIPKGYGEIDQLDVNLKVKNDSQLVKLFTNGNGDVLVVSITADEILNDASAYIPDDIPYENATVNGQEGLKWNQEGNSYFVYLENNDAIVLQSQKDFNFEDMIV